VARGSIVKRPSGNYAIRYWDHNGRRYYEAIGPIRKDADAALTQSPHSGNCSATPSTKDSSPTTPPPDPTSHSHKSSSANNSRSNTPPRSPTPCERSLCE
jgi:hypothetical protein